MIVASRIRVVLFDAVGTLIRPVPSVSEAYYRHGRRFGSRLPREEVARRFGPAFRRHDGPPGASRFDRPPTSEACEYERWRRIVTDVFDDVPDAGAGLFAALWDHFADPSSWSVFDDAAPAWDALAARGLTVGIASNFDRRLAGLCAAFEPFARCPHIFCSSQVGHPKPSPHFFAAITEALGTSPDEMLLIGDDVENDCLGARAAGWQALYLHRASAPEPDLPTIGTLAELPRLWAE